MKFVCISDTHCKHHKLEIPNGDVLIHAGDITGRGNPKDLVSFNEFLKTLPHKHKIIIAGNHDFCFENDRLSSEKILSAATYLQDSSIEIEGIKIYGSPWQPWFHDWAFNLHRGDPIKKVWDKIPMDTDVLITHGPPKGIGDKTIHQEEVGCEDLLNAVKIVQPKYHIFGHIHEGYGCYPREHTTFINASSCNFDYQAIQKAQIFEL